MIKEFNTYINEGEQWYPYRFKTQEEMTRDFGEDLDSAFPDVGWNRDMNRLLGTDFPYKLSELDLDSQKGNNCIDRLPLGDDNRYRDQWGQTWLICWDMLTKNKSRVPSYAPRKIDKTLESFGNNYKYDVIVFETLNEEQSSYVQEQFFKQRYRWSLRNDIVKSFGVYSYPIYLFVKRDTTQYNQDWAGNISYMSPYELRNYGGGTINDYIKHYSERGNNVCPIVFDYKSSSNLEELMRWGVNKPSYAPRKMDRTLESVDNKYNYDVHNSYYFNNYNTFIVIFNKFMDLDEFYNTINMLNDVFDECLRTKFNLLDLIVDIPNDERNYYISFFFDKSTNKWYTSWNNLGALKDDILNNPHKVYPTPFRYYDVNTWEKLKLVLDTGRVNPSYKPKKLIKTLESVRQPKYELMAVQVNSEDDMIKLEYMLEDISTDLLATNYTMQYPNWIFIDLTKHNDSYNNRYRAAMKWSTESKKDDVMNYIRDNDKVDKRIYTINELSLIRNMIISGGIIPSYKPRRFNKLLENINQSKYYNTHGSWATFAEIKEIEEDERENYPIGTFDEWKKKYNISDDDEVIWVTKNKKDAYHYLLPASFWDEIYDKSESEIVQIINSQGEDAELYEIDSSEGFLIPESDDGDGGFILVRR